MLLTVVILLTKMDAGVRLFIVVVLVCFFPSVYYRVKQRVHTLSLSLSHTHTHTHTHTHEPTFLRQSILRGVGVDCFREHAGADDPAFPTQARAPMGLDRLCTQT